MFAYCSNSPTNGCDPCGQCFHHWKFWEDCDRCKKKKAEREYCDSPDEAALAFARKYYASGRDVELGAMIYATNILTRDDNGELQFQRKYYYDDVYTGAHDNVVLGFIYEYLDAFSSTKITKSSVAWIHTHPHCECHVGDEFSSADEFLTLLPGIESCYLVTPGGALLEYNGKSLREVCYTIWDIIV